MNKNVYKSLKRAYNHDIIDREALKKARPTPFVADKINHLLGFVHPTLENIKFDTKPYTTHFRKDPHRKDEVVVTFLLYISNCVSQMKYYKTMVDPGAWEGEVGWMNMLKWVIYSVSTLMYRVEWNHEHFIFLDEAVADLIVGHLSALRVFFTKLGIDLHKESYPAEKGFSHYHSVKTFGPYYWRMLHWMAEAYEMRREQDLAKRLWLDFVRHVLYRTLRCSICMDHFRNTIQKYKNQTRDLPKMWYDIHNEVNALTAKEKYAESEFEKDREFMKKSL